MFLFLLSWEQERSRHHRKWRGEQRKESFNKDESEKDSDTPDSPPDSTETQDVAMARENLVVLMAEQKKIRKQKVMTNRTTETQTLFPWALQGDKKDSFFGTCTLGLVRVIVNLEHHINVYILKRNYCPYSNIWYSFD